MQRGPEPPPTGPGSSDPAEVTDLGFARLDTGRLARTGDPEVVYGAGKTPEQAVALLRALREAHPERAVLATRLADDARAAVRAAFGAEADVDDVGRTAVLGPVPAPVGTVAVISAGTSDAPVAAEAATTARVFGAGVRRIDDIGVAGLHRVMGVRDDLAAACPAPLRDLLNVGLLHTSIDGRPGHEPYAPARRETLLEKGYAYWALGHVHAREVVSTDPWVVFSGNLQGRHAREVGPKGATLITVEDGKIRAVEARALDAVRWAHVAVSATDARVVDDVLERASEAVAEAARGADGRLLAARITVSGLPALGSTLASETAGLETQLRLALVSESGDSVFLEKVRVRLEPARAAGAAAAEALLEATSDEEELERRELDRDLRELEKRLPPGLRADLEADHASCLDEALARARGAVRDALRRPEGDS